MTTSLFATDYNGEIFTWGYGDIIKNILDSIRMLVDNNGLATIFKAALGIAFLLFTFKKAMDNKTSPIIEFGKMMVLATGVWYLFLTAPNDARHRYVITDKVTGDQYVVEQVPTGIGEPLQIITELEDKIIAAMEKTFSLPNSLSYRNSGFGFPLSEQTTIANLATPDVYLQRSINDFVENCTINEITDGSKDVTQLVTANDLLAALDPNGDTRLTKVYSASNPNGDSKQCDDAYNYITNEVKNNEVDRQIDITSALLHTNKNVLIDRTNNISQLFFDVAKSARDYIQQNFIINTFKKSVKAAAAANGVNANQLAYADALTKQFASTQFAESGRLAGEYLPIIKGVLLALIVGLSWIMALLAVMFSDFKYIRMYFILLLWLMLWSPILVIINYIGDMFVSKIFTAITHDTGQTLTLFTSNKVDSTASNALGWLGYLVWLVPPLAYAIANASERGFVSLAQSLSQTASQASAQGASSMNQLGQKSTPDIRVGNEVLKSVGGAVQSNSSNYAYGHNYDTTTMHTKNGADTVSANSDTGGHGTATFKDGKALNGTYTSTQYNASASNQLVNQKQKAVEEAKQQADASQTKFTNALSSNITNAVKSGHNVKIDTSKATSAEEKKAWNEDITNSASKAFKNNKDWTKYADAIQKAAGNGTLGLKIIGGSGGSAEYVFSDGKGQKWTIKASEDEAKAFNQQFSQSVGATVGSSEKAQQDVSKVISSDDSKAFAQTATELEEMSHTFSKLQSAKEAFSYVESHSGSITKNALNDLYNSELKEALGKGYGQKEAVEYAMSQIDSYAQNGELFDKLQEHMKVNKDVKGFKSLNTDVDKNLKNSTTEDKTTNDVNHTHQEVNQGQKITEGIYNKNAKTQEQVKYDGENSSVAKSVKDNMTTDKNKFNASGLSNFNEVNKADSVVDEGVVDRFTNDAGNYAANLGDETFDKLNEMVGNEEEFDVNNLRQIEGFTKSEPTGMLSAFEDDKLGVIVAGKNGTETVETGVNYKDFQKYEQQHPDIMAKMDKIITNGAIVDKKNLENITDVNELASYIDDRVNELASKTDTIQTAKDMKEWGKNDPQGHNEYMKDWENTNPAGAANYKKNPEAYIQSQYMRQDVATGNSNTTQHMQQNGIDAIDIGNFSNSNTTQSPNTNSGSIEKDMNYFNHEMFTGSHGAEGIIGHQGNFPYTNIGDIKGNVKDFKNNPSEYFQKANMNNGFDVNKIIQDI
jgi:conjugal transfer mating pair stabilization protein TraG